MKNDDPNKQTAKLEFNTLKHETRKAVGEKRSKDVDLSLTTYTTVIP